jgi:hypothetical protein
MLNGRLCSLLLPSNNGFHIFDPLLLAMQA